MRRRCSLLLTSSSYCFAERKSSSLDKERTQSRSTKGTRPKVTELSLLNPFLRYSARAHAHTHATNEQIREEVADVGRVQSERAWEQSAREGDHHGTTNER